MVTWAAPLILELLAVKFYYAELSIFSNADIDFAAF